VSHDTVRAQLEALSIPALWSNAETRSKLRSLVPEYRLSKFQRVLPDRCQSEMIGAYLLDFEGTARLLAGS
jgi:ATP-dependent helicase Lhr and Lhr-like helicase